MTGNNKTHDSDGTDSNDTILSADAIIIGSGQGGVPLATRLAEEGRDVVIFERAAWGGTCVNTGCIPSKTLLASAHAAGAARHAALLGVHTRVDVDFEAVMARVRDSIDPEGSRERLAQAGVRLVKAEASFTGPHTVRGGALEVKAPLIVINTGKSPAIPDLPGLDSVPYTTYQTFWEIKKLPERLLVLGAGTTGLELAQAMQRLGSRVHLIEIDERVAADEEEDVSAALQRALREDGMRLHLDAEVHRVEYENGVFSLALAGREARPLAGDMLLVATGRRPNVEALNLAPWGIGQDSAGHVQVDAQFATAVPGVYAIGDVTGQPAFTHVSWEDYRRLYAILNGRRRQQGDRVLGYAVFTDPQVGRAGLTEAQAWEQGYVPRAVTLPLAGIAHARATGQENGFYRLVIDEQNDKILGATLVGPQAAELVHVILAHMEAGSTWQALERSQHIHPTYAEGLPTLARRLQH